MLPALLKLAPQHYIQVLRSGKRISLPEAQFVFIRSSQIQKSQWAVRIAKKNVGHATARNRLRRIVHEAIKRLVDAEAPKMYVIIHIRNADRFTTSESAFRYLSGVYKEKMID